MMRKNVSASKMHAYLFFKGTNHIHIHAINMHREISLSVFLND